MEKRKGLLILLSVLVLYTLIELPLLTTITKVWVDEPWYGGTAYNFSQGKGFTNENVTGAYGGDVIFVYPLFLGTFMKIFGGSLFASRMFSFLCGAILILISYLILKELIEEKKYFIVFFVLFALSSTVYIVFRTVRPEALKIIFSSLSLLFFIRGVKRNPLNFVFSGVFIMSGVLCHPDESVFAFIYFCIAAAYSMREKNIKLIVYYSSGALLVSLLFIAFLYFVKNMSLYEFYLYYGRRLSVYEGTVIGNMILKLNNIIKDYGLGIKRLYILLFEIGTLFAGLFYYRRNKKIFFISFVGFMFFVLSFIFLERIVTRGFISIIIFSVLTYTLILVNERKNKIVFSVIAALGALYLLNNGAAIGYLIVRDSGNTPYQYIEKEIDSRVDDGKTVLSHLNFYFPQKNNVFYNDYTIYKLTKYRELDSLLITEDIDYAVLSNSALTGETGTSGRTEKKESMTDFIRFYEKALVYAQNHLIMTDSIVTKGYGTIYFYSRNK